MLLAAVLTAGCGRGQVMGDKEGEVSQASGERTEEALPDRERQSGGQEDKAREEESFGEHGLTQAEGADPQLLPVCQTRHIYEGILSRLAAAYELPDMELDRQGLYEGSFSISDNQFAVADVDGDGREELIISYTTASMAGMLKIVYGYNPDTMELTRELLDFADTIFYDNGIGMVSAAHNHTLSMDFWPYTLYQYNPQTDQYDFLASVSAWDKGYGDVSYGENIFPEEEDLDGDGIIYEIRTDLNQEAEAIRYDGDDFQTWLSGYLGQAREMEITYEPVAAENFQHFTTDFLSLLRDLAEANNPGSQTDIGWLYIQKSSLEEARQYLSDSYGVQWKENPEFEYEKTGTYEGRETFSLIFMDGGILGYRGQQVDDVTVFGIYPGMDENTAVTTLMSYGFYPKENLENYMITGDGLGNAAVSYKIEDGIITEISVSAYCSYTG